MKGERPERVSWIRAVPCLMWCSATGSCEEPLAECGSLEMCTEWLVSAPAADLQLPALSGIDLVFLFVAPCK